MAKVGPWFRKGIAEIVEVVGLYPWSFGFKLALLVITFLAFLVSTDDRDWFLGLRFGFISRVIPTATFVGMFLPFTWTIRRQLQWCAAILVATVAVWFGVYGIAHLFGSSPADCLKFAKMTLGLGKIIAIAAFASTLDQRASTP
ncbi:MAG: hypothetical protein ABL949_03295 [Fimbriimonadaceae bacterium]